jgi:hypothetical protein
MRDSAAALRWIVQELERRSIPFALVGGIAANAYGTTRPLHDIDIDIPVASLSVLAKELEPYKTFGPERSVSECFECDLVGFSFAGQEIELSGAETFRIKDASTGEWRAWPTDLSAIERRIVFGISVPVMGQRELIAYKRLAGRETDLVDVAELERSALSKS